MAKLNINTEAPNFTALDYFGKELELSSFKGEKNVFLVLNRGFK